MNRSFSFIAAKFVVLQGFFISATKLGPLGYEWPLLSVGIALATLNYFLVGPIIGLFPYIGMASLFFFTGFLHDLILIKVGLIPITQILPPLWFPTLWLTFFCYYGDVFNKMLTFPTWAMSILGTAGGTLAYYRGLQYLDPSPPELLYGVTAVFWAIFMPFSLKLFLHLKLKKMSEEEIRSGKNSSHHLSSTF